MSVGHLLSLYFLLQSVALINFNVLSPDRWKCTYTHIANEASDFFKVNNNNTNVIFLDHSPKGGIASPTASGSPPTPIKLKIKLNTGKGLTSTVTLGDGLSQTVTQVEGQQDVTAVKGRRSSQGRR